MGRRPRAATTSSPSSSNRSTSTMPDRPTRRCPSPAAGSRSLASGSWRGSSSRSSRARERRTPEPTTAAPTTRRRRSRNRLRSTPPPGITSSGASSSTRCSALVRAELRGRVSDDRLSLVSATGVTPGAAAGRAAQRSSSRRRRVPAAADDACVFVDDRAATRGQCHTDATASRSPRVEIGRWWVERDDGVLTRVRQQRGSSAHSTQGLQHRRRRRRRLVSRSTSARTAVASVWDGATARRIASLAGITHSSATSRGRPVAFACSKCSVDGCSARGRRTSTGTGRVLRCGSRKRSGRSCSRPDGIHGSRSSSGFGPVLLARRAYGPQRWRRS